MCALLAVVGGAYENKETVMKGKAQNSYELKS